MVMQGIFVQLMGYSLDELHNDGELILHRAYAKQTEPHSVLVLTPALSRPSPETLKRIDHEYSLRSELDPAWAVRPVALSEQGAQMTLVLEDPGGKTLDGLLSGPMEMTRFLRLAVNLAAALRGLHQRKLIHKDVRPANVLVNPSTCEVRLMGFGIASHLPREHQAPEAPEVIAGTLPYMAPEQTGRMNRSIDSRSDLYALGVTLYEILTGSLPFTAGDPMEWVHCHVARQPIAPSIRLPGVPGPVSGIVMKLLAKTPEERYQTASGAESDLRLSLSEWENHGVIRDFTLGLHDTPDSLLIPEKLYGREREIGTLLAAFDRVVAGGRPELVMISGYSGIGKSAVVNELYRSLVPPRGVFASGKFDQYKRDIPYGTLAQAFQTLTRRLLTESEEELDKWRNALHEALDPNGQLIVSLIPELKVIIGEQPPVSELPQREAQARFYQVFCRFINVFARPEHPLALFLDDLQWLDAATLDFMEYLVTQADVKQLMLIGAYRDNEVNPTHPLVRRLQAMRMAGALLQDIVLGPLAREDLERLVADSLHCEPAHAGPLAGLVHDKTAGNPFFTIQFLSALFEEGLLTFDPVEGRWSWDLDLIDAKGYTYNVVDLMVRKLTRLHPETQSALMHLACLGNSADFATVSVVFENSLEKMHAQLAEAVGAGFIFTSKNAYHFLHDRIQEAAYSLIPRDLRAETHLRIGLAIASHTPKDKLEDEIFEIVNQLNRGLQLITSKEERERIAELNLIAGKRAKISTAYGSALEYLRVGRRLLSDEAWNHNYGLVFSIEYLLAECELLTADMTAAEGRLSMLAERAKSAHDVALVTRLRLTLYTALDRSDRAVEVFLDYWRRSGTDWSAHPSEEEVLREYHQIWSLLGDRQIEELVDLPLIDNRDVLDVLNVFTGVVSPALFTDAKFLALVICRMVCLSLKHGNSDASCYAYVWLGMLAGSHFGDFPAGFRFGKLGYDLVEDRGLRRYQARTYLPFGTLVVPWTKHIKTGREYQRRCFDAANRTGDLTYAAYSCFVLYTNFLAAGDPLAEVQGEAERGLEFATKIRFGLAVDSITAQLGLIRTLRGLTAKFGTFDEERFDELRFERHLASNRALALPACWYWIRKMQARFFAGDYLSAIEASLNAERLLGKSASFFEEAEYHFYSALSRAACFDSATDDTRKRHFDALAAHKERLESWTQHCPENFENRAALVGAEMARIEGRVLEAEQLYERAIRSARINGFVNNEGLSYELAARFYAGRGLEKFAEAYRVEARFCYQRWGADGKVKQLDDLYPHLKREGSASTPKSSISEPTELLDLATVIKLSQAVSGEMVLEKLIDSLMRAALEHAGADRALLILWHRDELQIEAEANTTGDDVAVHLRHDADIAAEMPESLVRYVIRTQESVILEDASSQNPFSMDPYIVQHHPRSILTLPLINQGKLISILHLENSLAPHVFTPERITILKVLASQAAMSLENSRLYRELEDRDRRIGRLIDSNIIGVVIWDLDGRLIDANDAFLRMVGYEREELQAGLSWFDMTPPDWQEVHARFEAEELQATGKMRAREKEYFRKDGSRVPVLIGAACFEDQPNQGVAYILDLSEQKRAEEALRRSEAYLAEAQRQTHTGSCAMDGVSRESVYWSDQMFRLFDFDPQQGPPKWDQFLERIHPADREKFRVASDTTFRTKANCDVEFRIVTPDGTFKHIHGVGQPVLSPGGDLVRVLGTMVDVTERKRAEEERERLRQAHRVVAETANDAVVTADESGVIQFTNPATAKVFGYAPGELVGKPLTILMPESMRSLHENGFGRYLATGERHMNWQGMEVSALRKNGQEFPVEVSFGELTMNGHRVFTGFIRDITERRRAEEERERLRLVQADLARLTRVSAMGELTASLAHEIRQPLTAALANAETCLDWLRREHPNIDEGCEAAAQVVSDVSRAAATISSVSTIFKKGALQRNPVDVNELIHEMVSLLGNEALRNSVIIRTELDKKLPRVNADRMQLQQVFMNLMLNGIDAMKSVSERGELSIKSEVTNGQVFISVTDAGVGLPPDQEDRIFEAFFTTKEEGTGMGLSISRSIIESHGGRLWATPNRDKGATLKFTLPAMPSTPEA